MVQLSDALKTPRASSLNELTDPVGVAAYFRHEIGLNEIELARALGGADPRSVRRWTAANSTIAPQLRYAERLDDLRDIATVLVVDGDLTAPQVGRWLRARSRALDGRRPLEILETKKDAHQIVRDAAEAFTYGDPT